MDESFWKTYSTHTDAGGQREPRRNTDLEDRLDKLSLICWAMWTLIQETTDLSEDDLLARVRDLDLIDGSSDGKVTRQIAKCPKCGRVMSPKHSRCLYCGAQKLILSAFDHLA